MPLDDRPMVTGRNGPPPSVDHERPRATAKRTPNRIPPNTRVRNPQTGETGVVGAVWEQHGLRLVPRAAYQGEPLPVLLDGGGRVLWDEAEVWNG